MDISSDEIVAYFKSNGASENCPFCNKEDWYVSAVDSDKPEKLILEHANFPLIQDNVFTQNIMQIIPFTCVTCGFVRLQHMHHLQTWISSRKCVNDNETDS